MIDINQDLLDQKNTANEIEMQDSKIEIKTRDKIHFVELSSILYMKADKDGTKIFLEGDSSLWTDSALKTFVHELSDQGFVRIHRGVVVNLNHILWINHSSLRIKTGEDLKIGRTYKKGIMENIAISK